MSTQSSSSTSLELVELGTGRLTVEDVERVARHGWLVSEIGEEGASEETQSSFARVLSSRRWVEDAVAQRDSRSYYGINTGFGSKAGSKALPNDDISQLSYNLIVSHSTGVGQFLHPEIVRAAMLIRANSLAQGYSGIRPEVINTLVRMLNHGVIPIIPEYGSVGASGDLAPLSHLVLVLAKPPSQDNAGILERAIDYIDSGQALLTLLDGEEVNAQSQVLVIDGARYVLVSGEQAMERRGIERVVLGAKEGLALNNGAAFSAAIAALALYDAENAVRHSEIAAAMTMEALLGFRDAFLPCVQKVRHHRGQIETAERILKMVEGSALVDGDADADPVAIPPQDAYSLRATPQVTGAVWDTLKFIRQTLTDEINAATDNPLIFLDPQDSGVTRNYKSVSGANFHGAPLAYAMDFLSIVMTDLGSLSERRIFKLTDPSLNHDLPAMLIADAENKEGLTSGLMIVQYLAASLVSDCKTLAHPDSVDSIPTSANKEDHVSMSLNAARHARTIVENVGVVIAAEMLCATVGLEWRAVNLPERISGSYYKFDKAMDPQDKDEDGRSRLDRRVLGWRSARQSEPTPGIGVETARQVIHDTLYPLGNALPVLGKERTTEDRFLQPYVLRMIALLRSGLLLRQVYQEIGVPVPSHLAS